MPWRDDISPYAVVVSEVMLQQTQVARVAEKFTRFLEMFPNFSALATATDADLLEAWQGLGYNRRALYLRSLARIVCETYAGQLPHDVSQLEDLPGIGPATARSIAAFAFNLPTVFIETNIRRVFLHHFFAGESNVSDKEIVPLIAETVAPRRAREWYWALMDYGSYLGKHTENPNRRSRHYQKQSAFQGSTRQLRGALLRLLLGGQQPADELAQQTGRPIAEVQTALDRLTKEGFVEVHDGTYLIQR